MSQFQLVQNTVNEPGHIKHGQPILAKFRVAGHLVISEQLAGCRSYSHKVQEMEEALVHGDVHNI